MNIKEPVLVSKKVVAIYNVNAYGTNIEVVYQYDLDDEGKGSWDYDLTPLYDGLNEYEIDELEDEFSEVISDIGV